MITYLSAVFFAAKIIWNEIKVNLRYQVAEKCAPSFNQFQVHKGYSYYKSNM